MSYRLKLILVSLWMVLSLPFNFLILRRLVRMIIWYCFHAYAALDHYKSLQLLLAVAGVVGVIILLFRGIRLGRTLAVALLAGSCIEMLAVLLIGIVMGISHSLSGAAFVGLGIAAGVLILNVVCIRLLTGMKSVV